MGQGPVVEQRNQVEQVVRLVLEMNGTQASALDGERSTRVERPGSSAPEACGGQGPAKRFCVELEFPPLDMAVDEVDIWVGHRFQWHRCKAGGLKFALELAVSRHQVALEDPQVPDQPFQ